MDRWPFATEADRRAFLGFRAAVARGDCSVRNAFIYSLGVSAATALARSLAEPLASWEDFLETMRTGQEAGELPLPVEEWIVKPCGGRVLVLHLEQLEGQKLDALVKRFLSDEAAASSRAWWVVWVFGAGPEIAPADHDGVCQVRLTNEDFPAASPGLYKVGGVRQV